MDAVTHLLRRSRLRSFAAAAGHAFHFDAAQLNLNMPTENGSTHDLAGHKRDTVEVDARFYASLNQFSPEELSSMALAEATSVAGDVAAAAVSINFEIW